MLSTVGNVLLDQCAILGLTTVEDISEWHLPVKVQWHLNLKKNARLTFVYL